jgi:hypothetical protein
LPDETRRRRVNSASAAARIKLLGTVETDDDATAEWLARER